MAKSVYISNLVLFVKKVFAMSELWARPESIMMLASLRFSWKS